MNDVCCKLLKELKTEDVIEHVGVNVKHEDARHLDVVNLLTDDHIVVHVVSLQVVDEAVNVELSVDDVHEKC